VPFSTLQITNSILLHKRVTCTYTGNNTRGGIVLRGLVIRLIDSVEIRAAASDLEIFERRGQKNKPPRTYLYLVGLLGDVFTILLIPDEVRPSRTNFRITDSAAFEL